MSPHATVCGRHRTLVPEGGRCPGCSSEESRRRGGKARAHGLWRANWRRVREQRIAYANGHCELQVDEGCTLVATTAHLDPALEGNHDEATVDDCMAACAHCHGVIDQPRSV